MICFDAKQSARVEGLYFSAFKPHQLENILLFGPAGAVSGALAEFTGDATAETSVRRGFYWVDWRTLFHFAANGPAP
jgi:hypothetical protein